MPVSSRKVPEPIRVNVSGGTPEQRAKAWKTIREAMTSPSGGFSDKPPLRSVPSLVASGEEAS